MGKQEKPSTPGVSIGVDEEDGYYRVVVVVREGLYSAWMRNGKPTTRRLRISSRAGAPAPPPSQAVVLKAWERTRETPGCWNVTLL